MAEIPGEPTLNQPTVSEWSSAVRVRGLCLRTGTKVHIYARKKGDSSKKQIGIASVYSADQLVSFSPGKNPTAADEIGFVQTFADGTPSIGPTKWYSVRAKPANSADLGRLVLKAPLFKCAAGVRIVGAVPGARINIQADGQSITSLAHDGQVFAQLPNLLSSEIKWWQSAPDNAFNGPESAASISASTIEPEVLALPAVSFPELTPCLSPVKISGVIPGYRVTFLHNGSSSTAPAYDGTAYFFPSDNLHVGDNVSATQAGCKHGSENSSSPQPATIVGKLPTPEIVTPPCEAAGSLVTIKNLSPGAELHVDIAGGDKLVFGVSEASQEFLVPPGRTIRVHQEACKLSSEAAEATADDEAVTVHPELASPIFRCTTTVWITKSQPGAFLTLISKRFGPIGIGVGSNAPVPIAVAALLAGDELRIVQERCGGKPLKAGPIPVTEKEAAKPKITRGYASEKAVRVEYTITGARVDVFLKLSQGKRQWLGSNDAGPGTATTVPLFAGKALVNNKSIFATQSLCGRESAPSPDFEVKLKPPSKAGKPTPANASKNVDPNVQVLKWSQKNEGIHTATRWNLHYWAGDVPDLTSTQFTITGALQFGKTYAWRVDSKNEDQVTKGDEWLFKIEDAPAPKEITVTVEGEFISTSPTLGWNDHTVRVQVPAGNGPQSFKLKLKVDGYEDIAVNCDLQAGPKSSPTGDLLMVMSPDPSTSPIPVPWVGGAELFVSMPNVGSISTGDSSIFEQGIGPFYSVVVLTAAACAFKFVGDTPSDGKQASKDSPTLGELRIGVEVVKKVL